MIKRTRDEWREIVKQWKASGKTMAAWCHERKHLRNPSCLDQRTVLEVA